MQLFYAHELKGELHTLEEQESKHIIRVLRMKCGDTIKLTDGAGKMCTGELVNEDPRRCEVKIIEEGPKSVYFIVPHVVASGAELSDDDLESVAGGAKVKGDANCDEAVLSTVVEINASLF